MKISSKARYGLAALASMAKHEGVDKVVAVVTLSDRLGISKIYLEQVFSILKRGGFVISVKGSSGGYHLAKPPKEISVYDIFSTIETAMFEKTEATVAKSDEYLEHSINENVYNQLDKKIRETLANVSLEDIINNAGDGYMYYL